MVEHLKLFILLVAETSIKHSIVYNKIIDFHIVGFVSFEITDEKFALLVLLTHVNDDDGGDDT